MLDKKNEIRIYIAACIYKWVFRQNTVARKKCIVSMQVFKWDVYVELSEYTIEKMST